MTHGFKNLAGRVAYQLKTSPRCMIFLAGDLLLCAAAVLTKQIVFILLIIINPVIYKAVEIYCKRYVTPCFFVSRFFGRHYIYQHRKKKIRKMDAKQCDEILAFEVENLIMMLPIGSFIAVTHEFLIIELLKADNIAILRCDEAYVHNLRSLQNNMFYCKQCPEKKECKRRERGAIPRQFYYVKFKKI